MIVYLITLIFILILGPAFIKLEEKTKRSHRKEYILSVSALLILQSGLRNWAVGMDTYSYYVMYEEIKSYTWVQLSDLIGDYYRYGIGKDPGYDIFQKIIQYVLPNFQLYLVLIAIIFFSSFGFFIYKNTASVTDAVVSYVLYSCLFMSVYTISALRQTIATAATLYGYELIKKRKIVPFLLLIVIASTIHKSVLIFIPFYFLAQLKKTKIFYYVGLFLFPVLMVYKQQYLEIMQDYGGYREYDVYEGAGTHLFSAMMLLVAIVGLWRMKTALRINKEVRPVYNAFIIALMFTPITWVNPTSMRIVMYFSIFMVLLLPSLINSFAFESKKLRTMALVVSLSLLVVLFINANINAEYRFYWQEMALGDHYN